MNYLKKGFRELLGGDKGSSSSSSTSRDASSSSAETAAISSPRAPEPLPLRAVVPHEPCAASLPDVAFDEKDERDAHVLFLWSVLEGAPAGSPNREDALESFLDGFAEAFDGWRPVSVGALPLPGRSEPRRRDGHARSHARAVSRRRRE